MPTVSAARLADFVAAIRIVAAGDALLAPGVTRRLLDRYADRLPPVTEVRAAELRELTDRELEVLKLVARGLNNRDIARELYISENTVKNHIRNIHEKLQVHSRMEAVVRAVREGVLQIA